MNSKLSSYHFQPVAVVRSCFKTKFGIPRQPGLISEARGSIELLPPYNQPNAVRGLEDFSHIWVLFVFHESLREGWKATVRPPRLVKVAYAPPRAKRRASALRPGSVDGRPACAGPRRRAPRP